jgi:4-amino-4-deoxy-L-arabinose transferase-like glycosyltransferase
MPLPTPDRLMRPIERLYGALTDPARCERAMALLLIGYTAVWALYGVIAKGSQDIHFDMGEAVAWSRELALGTPKHPPMSAWLVWLWFSVFPLEDWAYYLLAILLAGVALWIAWRLARDYLDAEKRVAGLALLTLLPFFNFHALKYNANTVLLPFWAATTWWFLRSYETYSVVYAALAGLGAAGAMLGKYWSIFLLAGLGIAALADARRSHYFGTLAPRVTVAAGALALAPHVAWIVGSGFAPFGYAVSVHAASTWTALQAAAGFLAGTGAYLAVPVALAVIAARPGWRAIADTLWPAEPKRRFVLMAFALPILLPMLVAVIAKIAIVSLWNMAAMTLLPVVLLSSPLLRIPRAAAVRILALAVAFPLLMLLASPVIAIVIHRQGVSHNATHYRLLAAAVDGAWRKAVPDAPLRLVGSTTNLLNGVVFYLADRPSTFDIGGPEATPWASEARIAREGIALTCAVSDAGCMKLIEGWAAFNAGAVRSDVELSRRYLGWSDPPVRYAIIVIPPRKD